MAALLGILLTTACNSRPEDDAKLGHQQVTENPKIDAAPLTKVEIAALYTIEGDTISPENAVSAANVETALITKGAGDFTIKSKVNAACQVKGCWMKVALPSGKLMHVTFKDYGFFVPKDVPGKEVVFQGHAYQDTLSVEELRHYAEDDGKSEKEILAITKPEVTYLFNANGVLIPKEAEAKRM